MAKLLGRAFIKYDGKLLKTEPKGAVLFTGGVERKGIPPHGYVEEDVFPYVECKLSVDKDTSLLDLNKITNATVTFEADTGQTWIIKDAWSVDPAKVTTGEGVPLKLEGMSCEEMK